MIIKSIVKQERCDVYDIINVKDNNNYVADGFVVHNSSADWAKCIDGNSLISTPSGDVKIKDLEGKENFIVNSYNEKTGAIEQQEAQTCKKIKNDMVYEIKTEDGKYIRATKKHKFLTNIGWKMLSELIVGDVCGISKIILIKKIGIRPVYDIINVTKNNNYIANNFVVHNSENKLLRKKLATVRTKHLLFILCFPLKIHKMEKNYLECLDGNSLVHTKYGLIKIKHLEGQKNIEVLSYDEKNKIFEYQRAEKCVKTKIDFVYSVKTSNCEIKATKDHRFYTDHGWKHLHQIQVGDTILSIQNKFETITSIIKGDLVDVYDILNVNKNQNYICNSLVVHNSFVNYWIDLFGRGVGAIYVKDRNPSADPWRVKDFKMVGAYTEFTKLSTVEKKLKKHPNFWQIIKFPKPPAWLYSKYLEVREKNIYNEESVRSMVTTEDIHKSLLILALQDLMMNDTTINMNRIILFIKNRYDIPITKKHVQNLLLDAKQLVTKIREENIS